MSSPVDIQHTRPKTAKKAVLNHLLWILIMVCQSIKNKKPELQTIVDAAKPDIILGMGSVIQYVSRYIDAMIQQHLEAKFL